MDGQAAESGGLTSENDSGLSKDENYQFDENMQVFKSWDFPQAIEAFLELSLPTPPSLHNEVNEWNKLPYIKELIVLK